MPDIKCKTKLSKLKLRKSAAAPKNAATILRQHRAQQRCECEPQQKSSVNYATDRFESGGKIGAALAASALRQEVRKQRKDETQEGTVPKKESAPCANSNAISAEVHTMPKVRNDSPHFSSGKVNPAPPRAFRGRPVFEHPVEIVRKTRMQALRRNTVKVQAERSGKPLRSAAKAIKAAGKTAAEAISAASTSLTALCSIGAVLAVVLLFVSLIAAIAGSPFGIFFSAESADADSVPLACAAAQVNYAFQEHLNALQNAESCDSMTIDGTTADWADVLAVFAAKTAGCDSAEAVDVVTMDADRIDRLKAVFSDMCAVSSEVESIDHPDSDPNDTVDDSWTERVLKLTLTPRTAEEMAGSYRFSRQQTTAMNELLVDRNALMALIGNLSAVSADAAEVIARLPADLPLERRAVVEAACSLVGKVTYFWGGKSRVIGWDNRWGQLRQVTADGSSTTGTYRPFGLDCSGFVDWVFYQATNDGYLIGHGGGATMQHRYCTPISWADALPGGLVFYPNDMHVGIVCGWDDAGNLQIIHCASSQNNVVITGKDGFAAIGRPACYGSKIAFYRVRVFP